VTEVYDIVGKLDHYILINSTSSKIGIRVHRAYQLLLTKRCFMKVSIAVQSAKLKYLKKSVCTSKFAVLENEYYENHVHTMINVFMDVLTAFVGENQTEEKDPTKFINDRWQSLYEYWINSNRNTSLDTQWILTNVGTSNKHPENFKMIYKMFVLCCVIRWETLRVPKQNFSHLPQFSTLYAQILSI
jgi:hypothetical protein